MDIPCTTWALIWATFFLSVTGAANNDTGGSESSNMLEPVMIFAYCCIGVGALLIFGGFAKMIHWGISNRHRRIQKNYWVNKPAGGVAGVVGGKHAAKDDDSLKNVDVEAFENDTKHERQRYPSEEESFDRNGSNKESAALINSNSVHEKKDKKKKKEKEEKQKKEKEEKPKKETAKERKEKERIVKEEKKEKERQAREEEKRVREEKKEKEKQSKDAKKEKENEKAAEKERLRKEKEEEKKRKLAEEKEKQEAKKAQEKEKAAEKERLRKEKEEEKQKKLAEEKEKKMKEEEEKRERKAQEKREEEERKQKKEEEHLVTGGTVIGGTVLGMAGEHYSSVGDSQSFTQITTLSDNDSAHGGSPKLEESRQIDDDYMQPRSVSPDDSFKAGSFHPNDSGEEGYNSGLNDLHEPEIVPQEATLLYDDTEENADERVSVHSDQDVTHVSGGSQPTYTGGYDNDAYVNEESYEMKETHQVSDHEESERFDDRREEEIAEEHHSEREDNFGGAMATTVFVASESSSSHRENSGADTQRDRYNSGSTSKDYEAASPLPEDVDHMHTDVEEDLSQTQVYNYDDNANDNAIVDDPPSEMSDRSRSESSRVEPTPPPPPPPPPPPILGMASPSSFSSLSNSGNKFNDSYEIPLRQDALEGLQGALSERKAALKKTESPASSGGGGGFRMQRASNAPRGAAPDDTHQDILKEFMGKLKRRNGGPKPWEVEAQQHESYLKRASAKPGVDRMDDEPSSQEISQRSDLGGSQISAAGNSDAFASLDEAAAGSEYAQSNLSADNYNEDILRPSTENEGGLF